jgi:hypothetical protein
MALLRCRAAELPEIAPFAAAPGPAAAPAPTQPQLDGAASPTAAARVIRPEWERNVTVFKEAGKGEGPGCF